MAEENYRKQWAEGEIEAGTLLDAIDALADENAKLRAIFDESERHLHHWHRQARSRALTIKGLEKELARQKLPEPRGSLAAQIRKAQETVSQWPDDIRAQNGINAERLAPLYTHPPVVAEAEPVGEASNRRPPWPHILIGMPAALHPDTQKLLERFTHSLAVKLRAAEQKYGYSNGWKDPAWMDECRRKLAEHTVKGDPRDVAAYCAFLWHHGESTAPPASGAVPVPRALLDGVLAYCDQLLGELNGMYQYSGSTGEDKQHQDADYAELRALLAKGVQS